MEISKPIPDHLFRETPKCEICGVEQGKVIQRILSKEIRYVRAEIIEDRCQRHKIPDQFYLF